MILHTQENNMRHIKYTSFLKKDAVSKLERPSEIIISAPVDSWPIDMEGHSLKSRKAMNRRCS